MSARQIIFTTDNPDTPLRWIRADGVRVLATGVAGSLAEYVEAEGIVKSGELIIILPGERFAARQISTPAKNRQQILQSARFLVEDDLAGSVDDMHLVVTDGSIDTEKTAIAVDFGYVNEWVGRLKILGLVPDILSIDFLCLAGLGDDDTAYILLENDRLLFFQNGNGFVSERSFSEEIVTQIFNQSGGQGLDLYRLDGEAGFAMPDAEQVNHDIPSKADLVSFYTCAIDAAPLPNLLQGALEPSIDWQAALGRWRIAAGLIAACLVLFLGTQIAEGVRLNGAASKIEQAAIERFRDAYPDVTVRNLRADARRLSRGSETGASYFLDLVALLTQTLEEGAAIQLLTITYQPSGQLVAEVRGATFDDIDRLEEKLTAKGITVSQGRNATQDDTGYTAKVFLEAGA